MNALKHKERWSYCRDSGLTVFYGSNLEKYLFAHADKIQCGRPVPYGEIPIGSFLQVTNLYHYSYKMCSADGSPIRFCFSSSHVFRHDSPEHYAEAKAKLLKNHHHPWFERLNADIRLANTDSEFFRDFPIKEVNHMARWVWNRVADHDMSFRAYAFSVIMCLLEGRLAIESLVARARSGMLPMRLKPSSFVFEELPFDVDHFLAVQLLTKTTPAMCGRFKNPSGITHCLALFDKAVGTFAVCGRRDMAVMQHRPAYFVLQTPSCWKLFYSDMRDETPLYVGFGKGKAKDAEKVICDKAKAHLLEIFLHQAGSTSAIQNLGQERFLDIKRVPTPDSEVVGVYESMLAHNKESIARLLTPPNGRRIRDMKEKENFEKMYAVMGEAFGLFFSDTLTVR